MEMTKAEVTKMTKYAKQLQIEVNKDPVKMRSELLDHINDLETCPKDITTWYNKQIEAEEEAEAAAAQAEKLVAVKEKAAKAKTSSKKSDVPKSQFNHRLHTQAGKIDECLKKGATYEDICTQADIKLGRVKEHMKHLEKKHGCVFEEMKNGKVKIASCA